MMCRTLIAAAVIVIGSPVAVAGERGAMHLTLESERGLRYDDNPFVDRRGLFGTEPVPHLLLILTGRAAGTASVREWLDVSLGVEVSIQELRFDLSKPDRTDDLRKSVASLEMGAKFHRKGVYSAGMTVPLTLVRAKQTEWSLFQVGPRMGGTYYAPGGLVLEAAYSFTGRFFDTDDPSETYGNIDLWAHGLELSAKWWLHRKLRVGLGAWYDYRTYDDNVGPVLARILFLPIERFEDPDAMPTPVDRLDHRVDVGLEMVALPSHWALVAVGYGYGGTWSNLEAFTHDRHGPRLAVSLVRGRHEGFGQLRLTLKDFHKFRFDTRYMDTRKDYVVEAHLGYGFRLTKWARLDLKYSFVRSDSNDASGYSYGHSRSYSRYQRNLLELTFTVAMDAALSAGARRAAGAPSPLQRQPGVGHWSSVPTLQMPFGAPR